MSIKTRGNYKIPLCIKFDCINRDRVVYPSAKSICEKCIKYSLYMKTVEPIKGDFGYKTEERSK